MAGDEFTEQDNERVPIEALPQAVARYRADDGVITLHATNSTFNSDFDIGISPLTLSGWWNENDLMTSDGDINVIYTAIQAGDTVKTTVYLSSDKKADKTLYRLCTVPDNDPTTGTLTLVKAQSWTDSQPVGDHIASVVSHDLRNPLDVAKARARAARETGDTEHFDRLDRAHDRMERIIGDVLTLTRGQGAVDVTPTVAIADIAEEAWRAVETGNASLSVAPTLPTAKADPDRLQRLFENLFRNSVEHGSISSQTRSDSNRSGGVPENRLKSCRSPDDIDEYEKQDSADVTGHDVEPGVTVSVEPTSDGFAVIDNGPGIQPAERARVFEPGYSTAGNGTGLGLTIVDRIADAHDWTVTATESEPGGTRFEITGLTGQSD